MTDEQLVAAVMVYLAANRDDFEPAVEHLCEALGLIVITHATAKAIDSIDRRLSAGAYVTQNEIRDVLYSVAVCSPDRALPKVYA